MPKTFLTTVLIIAIMPQIQSQEFDIGVFYGRFYAVYNYKDYGTGFRNLPGSQYNIYPSLTLNKKFAGKVSAELRVSFMDYVQYTGTRLYSPGFYSRYKGGNISLTANYSILQSGKFQSRIKGGIGLGIVPDMDEGEFLEMLVYPNIDSISRGDIKRNYTPLFPTFVAGFDVSYLISKKLIMSIAGGYQKGFIKITQYDMFYNDGSGNNDQRAKQWGTGDYYGLQLGLRYMLNDKAKK